MGRGCARARGCIAYELESEHDGDVQMLGGARSEQRRALVVACSRRQRRAEMLAFVVGTYSNYRDTPEQGDQQMTKSELIEEVAKSAGCSKADAERTLNAFFDLVVASTQRGEKVAWPGFGAFSTTQRKARTGRNPQTGATVSVPASTAMKFTASSTLKASLNPNRK